MKRVTVLTILFCLVITISAQDENSINSPRTDEIQTIFGNNFEHGGYGAIMFNYSTINDASAFLVGARGGWTINHVFTIGLAGYGFVNNVYIDNVIEGQGFDLAGGYGGLLLEATIFPRSPVHISFPVLIGAGGIALIDERYYASYDPYWYTVDSDAYFVIEPGVELEMNMVKFMRLGLAVTYRYTGDVNLINTNSDILNGFNFGLTFKFGKF